MREQGYYWCWITKWEIYYFSGSMFHRNGGARLESEFKKINETRIKNPDEQ